MPEHATLRGLLSTRPAVRVVIPLAAGIGVAGTVPATPSQWYALAVVCGAVLLLLRALRAHSTAADIFLLATVLLCGAASTSWRSITAEEEIWRPSGWTDRVVIAGQIVAPPVRSKLGMRLVVHVDSIRPRDRRLRDGTVLVRVRSKIDSTTRFASGMFVTITGLVEPFPRPRNPGEFDYGAYLLMGGMNGLVTAERIGVNTNASGTFSAGVILGRLQEYLYAVIDSLHTGDRGAFLKGVILGYRSELSEDLKEAFLATGTVHILAVSGGNVALIAMVGMVLFSFMRAGRTTLVWCGLASILFYMWVTGSTPSVVRATLMCGLVISAGIFQRRPDVYQSLAVAALVLLVADPWNMQDVGFQLSFASVFSIVVGVERVEAVVDVMPEEVRTSRVVRTIVQLMAVTFVAQIGTLPMTVRSFGQLSLVAVVANLVVVPLSGLVLIVGVVELMVAPISLWLAGVYASANDAAMNLLLGLVRVTARVPYAAVPVQRWDELQMTAAYVALLTVAGWNIGSIRRIGLFATVLLLNVIIWKDVVEHRAPGWEVLTLDVGQGDAHLVRFPNGKAMLIDTGPSAEQAERGILPVLDRLGVRSLETIVLTHDHEDHTGGVAQLLARIPVRTLTISIYSRLRPGLIRTADSAHCRIVRVAAGMDLPVDPSTRLYVVHPGRGDSAATTNNRSVVIRMLADHSTILFTGDAERGAEASFLGRYRSWLSSDVLKAAHHGSATGTTDPLITAVAPHLAVVSSGWRNKFNHPSPERMRALEQSGVTVVNTADIGAIWLRSDGSSWSIHHW